MAGETDLAAVAAWEPATVLFCGLMTKDFRGSEEDKNTKSIMADPGKYFTGQHRQLTREKLSKIRCPVIVTHGDVSALKKINFEFFFPELMNAGKKVTISISRGVRDFYEISAACLQCVGRPGSPEHTVCAVLWQRVEGSHFMVGHSIGPKSVGTRLGGGEHGWEISLIMKDILLVARPLLGEDWSRRCADA